MPCELHVDRRRHSGLVLDISNTGLFIQTNAKTQPGQVIEVRLSTGSGDRIALRTEVVRRKVVPPRLLALAKGGVGVRIRNAPESYFDFLAELKIEGARTAKRFRVRVKQISGPRSRSVEVEASDASGAEERALVELGEGWKVLAIDAA
jgi:hypothetical protein